MMNYDPYYLSTLSSLVKKPQMQDIGGLAPVFQSIAQQQANQNMAIQQGQGLAQQAGQNAQSGFNPMALASMLRGGQTGSYLKSIPAMMKYGASNVYGGFGQGQTPTDVNWDLDIQGM